MDINGGEHIYPIQNKKLYVADKKEIIKKHNIESKYDEYSQFEEIKLRIKLTTRNLESPITQVFWLGSNYPRRMSEYCIDVECI